ncbi:MAG: hypothetical protein K8S23_00020 [Candidatus Cloacimonetes bacterium]|nr:hypothetical protein [Candidatus Cloacimonadota bacterium]
MANYDLQYNADLYLIVLPPPENFTGVPNWCMVRLTWDTVSGNTIEGYNIYISDSIDGVYTLINDQPILSDVGYYDYTLQTNGFTKYFKISSVNNENIEGDLSESIVCEPQTEGSISNSTIWSGNIYITGDVIIESDGFLTINAGTVVNYDEGSANISVIGEIFALGSSANFITFKNTNITLNDIESEDPIFQYCFFEDSGSKINCSDSNFEIEFCEFVNCGQVVNSNNSTFKIANSNFDNSSILASQSEIELTNLDITGSTITSELSSINTSSCNYSGSSISLDDDDIYVQNCNFTGSSIDIDSIEHYINVVITDNDFGSSALSVYSANDGNYVSATINNNFIHDSGSSPLSVIGRFGTFEFSQNIIDNCCGGNIIKFNSFRGSGSISNNFICNNITSSILIQIHYSDNGSGNIILENNVICNNDSPIIIQLMRQNYPHSATIINNTISYNQGLAIENVNSDIDLSIINSILWYNQDFIVGSADIIFSNLQTDIEGEGNISEEPNFIDYLSTNFYLDSNSPCIDSGTIDVRR